MKRFEPNLLLAAATALPLALLITTATLFGAPGQVMKYVATAIIVPLAFIPLNAMFTKKMGMPRPPMIHPQSAATAVWASIFPALIFLAAAIPVFFPGNDFGLLIVIASVFFAGTVDSARKARRA